MTRPVLFLDDGGVMNENARRAAQWQRLVGEFFSPRLGGTAEAWAAANRVVANRMLTPAAWDYRLQAAQDYLSFDRAYQLEWLGEMVTLVGVPMPDEATALALAREAVDYITRRVQAAFPGAIEAIRTLHAAGYRLYTASGEASSDLEGYLAAMGVRGCFTRLYGPDLVDTFKAGPDFYTRIFADAGVDPATALVVDDNAKALAWAAAAGARTVHITADPGPGPHPILPALAALPAWLAEMENAG